MTVFQSSTSSFAMNNQLGGKNWLISSIQRPAILNEGFHGFPQSF